MVLGSGLNMLVKALVCIVATAIGLYGAWLVGSLARYIYIERVNSFDELSEVIFAWFMVAAVVLCPLLCWSFLKLLKRIQVRRST